MKVIKACLAILLIGSTATTLAANTSSSYSTTLTSLSIQQPEMQAIYPSDPTPKPRSLVLVPTLPNNCISFPFASLFQLNDLTDDAQKQMYATLMTAKINGLSVNLTYIVEPSMLRCRIVGVSL